MPRKEFAESVIQSVLIKCRRHCCICGEWCGQRIAIHHIGESADNSEENALPLCFNCHADVRAYDPQHPIGKRYAITELRQLRQKTFAKYSGADSQPAPSANSEYGRGFHEGAEWARSQTATQEIWRILSTNGDFALEILYYFREDDTHTMMDEKLMSNDVDTGLLRTQAEGHTTAWVSGEVLGLWGINADTEKLFLTEKGILFRNLVRSTPELSHRYSELEKYWSSHEIGTRSEKPKTDTRGSAQFPPGPMNALSLFVNCIATTTVDPSVPYVIRAVDPASATLTSVADGSTIVFPASKIQDVRVDQSTGNFIIEINKPDK